MFRVEKISASNQTNNIKTAPVCKIVQAAAEETNGLCGTSKERGQVGQQGVCWSGWISLFGDKCLFCLTFNRETSPDAFNLRLKSLYVPFPKKTSFVILELEEPSGKCFRFVFSPTFSNKEKKIFTKQHPEFTVRQDTHHSEWILSVKWKSCSCPSACREENRGSSPWGPLQQRGFLTRCTLSLKRTQNTQGSLLTKPTALRGLTLGNPSWNEAPFYWKDRAFFLFSPHFPLKRTTESLEITPVVAQSKNPTYSDTCQHLISFHSVSHSNTPCWF